MSVQTPAPRPTRGEATTTPRPPVSTTGAVLAALRALAVLAVLVVVLLAFVLAPLAVLGVGAVGLLAARVRSRGR